MASRPLLTNGKSITCRWVRSSANLLGIHRGKPKGQKDGDDEDGSSEEEEESEEESEEEVAPVAGASAQTNPTLGRAERKAEKKRLAQEKAGKQKKEGDEEDSDDADLVNLNRATAKGLSIKDLAAPRELSRRERSVQCPITDRATSF
jgi:hypothetical protein